MRQHPHLVHPKQQQRFAAQQPQLPHQQQSLMDVPKKHKRPLGGPYLTQQRSFSSSEEDLRSTPEFEDWDGKEKSLAADKPRITHSTDDVMVKQELLSKTGQWIHKNTVADGLLRNRMESDMAHQEHFQMGLDPHDPSDKRPKLERARSAAEKENLPLQRSGSMLRRQYSQQEQPTHRMGDSAADLISPGQRRMQPQYPGMQPYPGQQAYGMQQQPMGMFGLGKSLLLLEFFRNGFIYSSTLHLLVTIADYCWRL
uniref:Uncharacterized protein n=1 Tax=Phlebotomus papatasi TaxID=29031 RepID=A0A1B0DN85_PHLPP